MCTHTYVFMCVLNEVVSYEYMELLLLYNKRPIGNRMMCARQSEKATTRDMDSPLFALFLRKWPDVLPEILAHLGPTHKVLEAHFLLFVEEALHKLT